VWDDLERLEENVERLVELRLTRFEREKRKVRKKVEGDEAEGRRKGDADQQHFQQPLLLLFLGKSGLSRTERNERKRMEGDEKNRRFNTLLPPRPTPNPGRPRSISSRPASSGSVQRCTQHIAALPPPPPA
jgi:hypothetical protein